MLSWPIKSAFRVGCVAFIVGAFSLMPLTASAQQTNTPQLRVPQNWPEVANTAATNVNSVLNAPSQPRYDAAVQTPGNSPQYSNLPEFTPVSTSQSVTPETEPATAVDPTDPQSIADAARKAAEDAKNTFGLAIKGDRDAQIKLATKYLLPLAVIFCVMIVASWIGNYVRDRVTGVVSRRVDMTLGRFAGKFAKFMIMAVALMCVLGHYGVEMTSFAALIAALGFAIGMALQGTLGNFAAGIALLVFRPFNVGDYIIVDGVEGSVRAIDLFTTTLDTHDNRRIIVPNDSVFGNKMENWSFNETRRVDVLVGVSYTADMKQTRQVLSHALAGVPGALATPGPQVYLCELNASSVDWSCRVWCRQEDYLAVKERVTEVAKEALDKNGIGIPFPQLDLHVVTPNMQQRSAAA